MEAEVPIQDCEIPKSLLIIIPSLGCCLQESEGRRNKGLGEEDVERSREKRKTPELSRLPVLCSHDMKLHKHPSLPRRPRKAVPSLRTSLILLSSFIISTGFISFF